MYAACDLYVVSSKTETGPQAIFEASAMRVPIVSNPVGISESVFNFEECVFDITKNIYFPTSEDAN